jgi:hypothetical protein
MPMLSVRYLLFVYYVVYDVAGCVIAVVCGVLWVWWRSIRVCGVVLGGCGGASVTMVL